MCKLAYNSVSHVTIFTATLLSQIFVGHPLNTTPEEPLPKYLAPCFIIPSSNQYNAFSYAQFIEFGLPLINSSIFILSSLGSTIFELIVKSFEYGVLGGLVNLLDFLGL